MEQKQIDEMIDLMISILFKYTGYYKGGEDGKTYIQVYEREVQYLLDIFVELGKAEKVNEVLYRCP
ncbi:MAG: hypothetical protein ACP5M9_04365 [Candidatus Micrarchaeia archaeon]